MYACKKFKSAKGLPFFTDARMSIFHFWLNWSRNIILWELNLIHLVIVLVNINLNCSLLNEVESKVFLTSPITNLVWHYYIIRLKLFLLDNANETVLQFFTELAMKYGRIIAKENNFVAFMKKRLLKRFR